MTTLEFLILAFLGVTVAGIIFVAFQLSELKAWRKYTPFPFFSDLRLDVILRRAEQESGITLTWGARAMLTIPVVETLQLQGGDVNWTEVDSSVRLIIGTLQEERDREQRFNPFTSISVIRAFFRRFCNIPPFCSRTER